MSFASFFTRVRHRRHSRHSHRAGSLAAKGNLALVLLATLYGGAHSAAAQAASCQLTEMLAPIELGPGMQREINLPTTIRRLAVGNPEVADVQLTSGVSFLITAKTSGVTNVSVWTPCSDAPQQSMLFVKGSATSALTQAVPIGTPVLPSQVQTDIRFVEVSRSKLRDVGISLSSVASNNFLFGSPGAAPGRVNGGAVSGLTPSLPLSNQGFNIVWGGGGTRVLAALNALEGSGFAYTLSQPSLVAMSGQSASFLAGGEFPVPVPSSNSNNFSIQYKEFGVRLTLTPTVVSNNRIVLKVAPEVSELDFNNGVSIGGTTVPALTIRRTDTSVQLANGESFVISGLMSTRNQSMVDKLPGLGDVPVLGAFFRSSHIDREERELLMIVTPHLVQPLASDAPLPDLPGEAERQYSPNLFEQLFDPENEFNRVQGLSR
jgi:pilus assembly protein CpaC